jgi:hypothetical protein
LEAVSAYTSHIVPLEISRIVKSMEEEARAGEATMSAQKTSLAQ